jgi:perosamine synthetase
MGDLGCYSFNGNKLITTGGGGMVVSNNPDRAGHIKFLVNQARVDAQGYFHPEVGFNYRMTNIEAALGLAQMEQIGLFLEKKRRFSQIYEEVLGELPYIKIQKPYHDALSSRWLTCVIIEKDLDLNGLIRYLKDEGIQTRRVFMPADKMPYLKEFSCPSPEAEEIYQKGLCLPSSTQNAESQVRHAAETLRDRLEVMIRHS